MSIQPKNCAQCGSRYYPPYESYAEGVCRDCWEHTEPPLETRLIDYFPWHEVIFFAVSALFGAVIAKVFF